ncbi:MAG: hypothetical protein HOI29_05680 [Planctomycetes bacterium]|jgi:hypothetical protein|nr:hypothetical protein [Planctomycetota bacterium]MBT6541439.1 hypothetical protein [Planctomycetota bacterium]
MSKRLAKRPPSPPRATPKAPVDPDSNEIDFGDVTLGITALIGIPVVTLVLLGLIGMPFGGTSGDNPEQAEQWRQVKLYRPSMTTEEAQLILTKVQFWVDDRAKDYIRRSRLTEDSHEKNFWQEVAKGVLSPAENELSAIIDAAAKQKKIPEEIRDATLQWISKVDKLRTELDQEDPFRQIR